MKSELANSTTKRVNWFIEISNNYMPNSQIRGWNLEDHRERAGI